MKYPENKEDVTQLLKEDFSIIEEAKRHHLPISPRKSIILGTIGKWIVLYGVNIDELTTEELFAALMAVNGNVKKDSCHYALKQKQLQRKNELQVAASKRIGVEIRKACRKFPRNTLEISFDMWSTHLPIQVARRLGIPVPPVGKKIVVRKN